MGCWILPTKHTGIIRYFKIVLCIIIINYYLDYSDKKIFGV